MSILVLFYSLVVKYFYINFYILINYFKNLYK